MAFLSRVVVAFVPSNAATTTTTTGGDAHLRAAYVDEGYPRDGGRRTTSSGNDVPFPSSSANTTPIVAAKRANRPPNVHPISGGRVTLVGAGPGSPDLLTVAAYRILSDPSNLVIVDRLVSAEILELVRGEVKIANKHPGCADVAQREIYDWVNGGVLAGRHVVRLKIGDPFVFGRGGEEVLEFRETLGIEPTVVPGVSAAFAAPLLGSIPVTHRGISNQVVMCTGYGKEYTSPDLIRYHPEQTVVFLMAVGRLRMLCNNLVELANYPRDTPVAIIERAGCPDQRTVVGNIGNISDMAERYDVKPPSTIVVGNVVNVLLTDDDFVMVEEEEGGMGGSGVEDDDVMIVRGRGGLIVQPISVG